MSSPATFDYEKLDWMNGVYLRELQPDEYAHDLDRWLGEQGIDWPRRPRARDGAARAGEDREVRAVPRLRALPVRGRDAAGRRRRAHLPRGAQRSSRTVEPWAAEAIEQALRALVEELGEKPRTAFAPIRLAVTGSKVSPGLFESLELLGRDGDARAAQRSRGGGLSGFGGASGSSACWNCRQALRRYCSVGRGRASHVASGLGGTIYHF